MYTVCGHIMSCRHVDEEEGYSSMYIMYQSCKSIPILICFFVHTGGVTQQDLLDKLMPEVPWNNAGFSRQVTAVGWLDDVGWFQGSNVSGFHQFLQIFDFSSWTTAHKWPWRFFFWSFCMCFYSILSVSRCATGLFFYLVFSFLVFFLIVGVVFLGGSGGV